MTIGVIVQARMSSQRLPGKVLRKVSGKSMLQYTLERIALVHGVDGVIVATSDEASDNPIAAFCKRYGVPCFRGSLTDVAGRFIAASDAYGFDAFVRVCGDSPFTDSAVISTAVALFRRGTYDLVTNTFPRSFPVGTSIEVVRLNTYCKAYARMTESMDREHVTRYYYQHPEEFRIHNFSSPQDNSTAQLAVDTPEDWKRFERILQQMDRPHATYGFQEILVIARRVDERVAASIEKHQAPSTKFQTISKLQAPNSKPGHS